MSTPSTNEKPTILRPPTRIREDPTLVTHPPVKPKPVCAECKIDEMPNGEGIATIVIPSDVLKRLKMRAQGVTVAEYTWSAVIRPALYGATY
jgi:hypothetical protein